MYVCMYAYIADMYIYVCVFVCFVCLYVSCMYVCKCVCIYVCMYVGMCVLRQYSAFSQERHRDMMSNTGS